MSAGNPGNNGTSPPEGDDPFGYLYRQEGGAAGPPPAPPQPSYRQVRPVGERTYAGQQGGYGYPPQQQQNAYYAAPETQPGGGYPGGPGPGRYDDEEEPPRRNTMLIGAIAVVTAVVLGVGAAILFSGDDDKGGDEGQSQQDPGPSDNNPGEGDDGDDPDGDDDGEDEDDGEDDDEDAFEPLEAVLTSITPLEGAYVNTGGISGARSADGSYVDGLNQENSTIVWNFEFDGTPGDYRLFIGYSVPDKDQKMSLAINEQIRDDKINFDDYLNGRDAERSQRWFSTFRVVSLKEGANAVYIGCAKGDTCDVLIDKMEIVENGGRPAWAPGSS